jgi:hypothetical protein
VLLLLAAGLVIVVALALYLAAHTGTGGSLRSPSHSAEQPVPGD